MQPASLSGGELGQHRPHMLRAVELEAELPAVRRAGVQLRGQPRSDVDRSLRAANGHPPPSRRTRGLVGLDGVGRGRERVSLRWGQDQLLRSWLRPAKPASGEPGSDDSGVFQEVGSRRLIGWVRPLRRSDSLRQLWITSARRQWPVFLSFTHAHVVVPY